MNTCWSPRFVLAASLLLLPSCSRHPAGSQSPSSSTASTAMASVSHSGSRVNPKVYLVGAKFLRIVKEQVVSELIGIAVEYILYNLEIRCDLCDMPSTFYSVKTGTFIWCKHCGEKAGRAQVIVEDDGHEHNVAKVESTRTVQTTRDDACARMVAELTAIARSRQYEAGAVRYLELIEEVTALGEKQNRRVLDTLENFFRGNIIKPLLRQEETPILFINGDDGDVYSVSADGSNLTRQTWYSYYPHKNNTSRHFYAIRPRLTPSGHGFVFVRIDTNVWPVGDIEIYSKSFALSDPYLVVRIPKRLHQQEISKADHLDLAWHKDRRDMMAVKIKEKWYTWKKEEEQGHYDAYALEEVTATAFRLNPQERGKTKVSLTHGSQGNIEVTRRVEFHGGHDIGLRLNAYAMEVSW